MTTDPGSPGTPAARPVPVQAYREHASWDGRTTPWYRDAARWVHFVLAFAMVLAWLLTDLGPAAWVTAIVAVTAFDVRDRVRRGGVLWWTVGEVVLAVLITVVMLTVTSGARALSGEQLAAQVVGGAVVGAVVVALTVRLSRRRAAPAGPPTAG